MILVKELFMLVVVRSEFHDEYQTCPEFYDDRVHQISAFMHIHTKSYKIFSDTLLAIQIN
jgi:hypothetical protein